jgi:hypothetical protein
MARGSHAKIADTNLRRSDSRRKPATVESTSVTSKVSAEKLRS